MGGQSHPDRPDDRGRDGARERGAAAPDGPGVISQETHVGELLAPITEFVDRARLAIALVAGVIVLVVAGAKLERYLMKRQLQVVDGGDIEVSEGADGGRR